MFFSNDKTYFSKASTRSKQDLRKPPPSDIERRVYGLMERFTSRAKLFEITSYPGDIWDDLSRSIWEVYTAKAQKAATYIKKLHLWQNVYLQIKVFYCLNKQTSFGEICYFCT